MTDYLPKDATIEQACNWLQAKTAQTWILPRLLECHLMPHFWLDYEPGYPAIFGNKIEGFQTSMMFQGDLLRLESDGANALVNMLAAHDGGLIKVEPGWRVPLAELRFKRDQVERVAAIINRQKTAPAQSAAMPATVVNTEPDLAMLVTRQQLIDAYGAFTGLNATWFSNIKDTPALLAARKVAGQGGRGHIAEPLFCPFEVLQWLIDPARRKGRPLGCEKGWQLFERHFPRAYAAFSVGDPRTD